MTDQAFVYPEMQIAVPFAPAVRQDANPVRLRESGLQNKTWLPSVVPQTPGSFYEFDSIENAKRFVIAYFPARARSRGVAQTTRVFDGSMVAEASRPMRSPFLA